VSISTVVVCSIKVHAVHDIMALRRD
jgi:hypothetical protein